MELADPVAVGEQVLKSRELLDVVEVLKTVVVDLYALDGVARLE